MSAVQPRQGKITVTDFCDVSEQAGLLGLNDPQGLALLPRYFRQASTFDELFHEETTHTIRTLFRLNEIPETRVERHGQKIPIILQKNFDLMLPTLFVGGILLSENPQLLDLALSVIANYVTDVFKGIVGTKDVTFRIIEEVDKEDMGRVYKKVEYKGPAEGIKELRKTVREVYTGEENR